MSTLHFELSDGVTVGITITDQGDGTLRFDLSVLEGTGTIGDLNGLFFDIADESLLSGLTVTGDDITGAVFKADAVTKGDSYNTVNGEITKDYGKFDAGVQFGTQGMAQDDIQDTSFVLSHDSVDLTLDTFLAMDFAVRLTSVGDVDGAREDSLKIGGTAPDTPAEDPGDSGPVYMANNDFMSVSNAETFSPFGMSDPLANFALSLLENDTMDDVVYTGDVLAAQGQDFEESIVVAGSNGGLMLINRDGTVDFSANGDFDFLVPDQTSTTQFAYEIEGGAQAIVDVEVFAVGDFPGDFVF